MERIIIRIVVIILVISVTVYLFAKEISHVYALHRENEKVLAESRELDQGNGQIRQKMELMNSDSKFVEKIIRKELRMIKEGEKVYRFQE